MKKKRRRRKKTMNRKILLLTVLMIGLTMFFSVVLNDWRLKVGEQAEFGKIYANKPLVLPFQDEVDKWKPSDKPRSYLDHLRYFAALKLQQDDDSYVRISTLGSSVTEGAGASDPRKKWSTQLFKYIKAQEGLFRFDLMVNGFGGYNTREILEEDKVDLVIAQKPNLILFETCMLNDHGEGIPIQESLKNIAKVVNKFNKKLPNAEVILISPNPKGIKQDVPNSLGLYMDDYNSAIKQYIHNQGWEYIDIYGSFKIKYKKKIDSVLTDGVHPNDLGYQFWFETLEKEFEKKR
ncbi:lysophospholipase L1-like esterase [Paenibacillus sp. DS2015]|uniref:SGNH/GDSL hydrolase family protein n=1 Tax=Paenibacillus sp. DS2015 TaxID=3373917 RepID=UPI003D1E83B2